MADAVTTTDVIVIGAGAAGLMCAIEAAGAAARPAGRPCREGRQEDPDLGRRPLQFHQPAHRARPLHLGQPAFLHLGAPPLHPAIHRPGRTPRHRLPRKEAGPAVLRRLAREIVGMLLREMRRRPAYADAGHHGQRGSRRTDGSGSRPAGQLRPAGRLVVATGGKSIPKMGATGFGYEVASQFGLKSCRPAPALCR